MNGWSRQLMDLLIEMETFYGDPAPGTSPEKIESLVRFAWEESFERKKRLEERPWTPEQVEWAA